MNKLFLLVLVVFAACDPKPAPLAKVIDKPKVTAGIGDWKVSLVTAVAMINSAKGKACNAFTITNLNPSVRAAIDSAYPSDKFTITQVNARYLPNADEAKYRKLRGMPPGSAKGNIRGYCTTLLYVKSISTKQGIATEDYFDIYSTCPPPPDCDTDSTH